MTRRDMFETREFGEGIFLLVKVIWGYQFQQTLGKLILLLDAEHNFTRFLHYPLGESERVLETRREMFEGFGEVLFAYKGSLEGSMSEFRVRIAYLFDPEGRRVKCISDFGDLCA